MKFLHVNALYSDVIQDSFKQVSIISAYKNAKTKPIKPTFSFKMARLKSTNFLVVTLALPFFLLFADFEVCVAKKDRNRPHIHNGVLPQYTPGPFTDLVLEKSDEKTLSDGKSVMKQIPNPSGDKGGRAICVQDVEAPKNAVWNQILDLNSYVGKVDKLKECKNYFKKRNPDGTTTIKTKFIVGVLPGYKVCQTDLFF